MAGDNSEKLSLLEIVSGTDLLFAKDVDSMSREQSVGAWTVLDLLEKVSKDRKELNRLNLLEISKEGEPNEDGSRSVEIDGTTIVAEARTPEFPDEKLLKAILKSKGLPLDSCFDQVTAYQLNPHKLDFLVDQGKVTKEEVDSCRKTTYALKVKPNKETKAKLNDFKNKIVGK